MREKIHKIIDVQEVNSTIGRLYNAINIIIIILSISPLMFRSETDALRMIDQLTVTFFIIEYIFHWGTADYKYPNKSKRHAFLTYPITFFGVVDLLSILPSITFVSHSFRLFRLFRLFQSLRVLRVFKIFRYSKSVDLMKNVLSKQREPLTLVAWLTTFYIIITSLLVFNVEPETFPSYLDALYWSVGALTTATFGEMFPKSNIGQIISMFSYLVGVVIIAVPSSIITAGYIEELEDNNVFSQDNEEDKES